MIYSSLTAADLTRRLKDTGVGVDLGGARVRIRCDPLPGFAGVFQCLYGPYAVEDAAGFFDATVEIRRARGLRRFVAPQIELVVDATTPFEPFPADTHIPLLEWGVNFALAERFLHSLLLHAAVVERAGRAVVMPAIPGSGKSTLTAALMCRGYRLLSDEFGALSLTDGLLTPILKPVALKNESIGVIRRLYPEAILGPVFPRTRKGDVAHLAPDDASVLNRAVPARPALILFPKFTPGAPVTVDDVDSATAFGKLAVNSFNYEFLGSRSFDAVARLVRTCQCKRIVFGNLTEATAVIDSIVENLATEPDQDDGEARVVDLVH